MKHKFQNPLLKHIVRELIRLDLEETQERDDAASLGEFIQGKVGIVQGNAEAACQGCNDCKCCGTDDTSEYLSVKEYAEDFGITLGTGAAMQLNDAAMKESARQKQVVGEADNLNVYHPDVLKIVFGPLLKTLGRV